MLQLVKPRLICNGCGNYINYSSTFFVGVYIIQKFYFHNECCISNFYLHLDTIFMVNKYDENYDYYDWSYE